MLADALMAGMSPAEVAPKVMAHLDHCPKCEGMFLELLDDLQVALVEPVPIPTGTAEPDLSFLPLSPTPAGVWRTTLDAALEVVKAMTGRLQSISVSLSLPAVQFRGGALVRERPPAYIARRPFPGVLAAEDESDKLLYVCTLEGEKGLQIELRAQREPDATECRLLAEVDSPQPDALRPNALIVSSGANTWKLGFNEWGQAVIEQLPVVALAGLGITLSFEE